MQSAASLASTSFCGHPLHLDSEHSIEISSSDPDVLWHIRSNCVSSTHNRQAAVDLIRYMRRYAARPALAPYVAEELRPGQNVSAESEIVNMASHETSCGVQALGSYGIGRDANAVVADGVRGVVAC